MARGKDIGVASLNAESGGVYYFQVRIRDTTLDLGPKAPSNWVLEFSPLGEDEGQYREKISALAVATPKS